MLTSLLLATHLIASTQPANAKIEFSEAYQKCLDAVRAGQADQAIVKCEEPATAGIPAAEYILGAMLANRGLGDDESKGVAWLEKAVATGSPAAAYHLASVLLQRKNDDASIGRGKQLLRYAVCAGYPQAVNAVTEAGATKDTFGCAQAADVDFNGDWTISLRWDKTAPAGASTESYRLSVNGTEARVFIKSGGEWVEAKPGKFKLAQQDQSVSVSVTDSGWDYDGKWIESWTINSCGPTLTKPRLHISAQSTTFSCLRMSLGEPSPHLRRELRSARSNRRPTLVSSGRRAVCWAGACAPRPEVTCTNTGFGT